MADESSGSREFVSVWCLRIAELVVLLPRVTRGRNISMPNIQPYQATALLQGSKDISRGSEFDASQDFTKCFVYQSKEYKFQLGWSALLSSPQRVSGLWSSIFAKASGRSSSSGSSKQWSPDRSPSKQARKEGTLKIFSCFSKREPKKPHPFWRSTILRPPKLAETDTL